LALADHREERGDGDGHEERDDQGSAIRHELLQVLADDFQNDVEHELVP
jgi:hypothetical protein